MTIHLPITFYNTPDWIVNGVVSVYARHGITLNVTRHNIAVPVYDKMKETFQWFESYVGVPYGAAHILAVHTEYPDNADGLARERFYGGCGIFETTSRADTPIRDAAHEAMHAFGVEEHAEWEQGNPEAQTGNIMLVTRPTIHNMDSLWFDDYTLGRLRMERLEQTCRIPLYYNEIRKVTNWVERDGNEPQTYPNHGGTDIMLNAMVFGIGGVVVNPSLRLPGRVAFVESDKPNEPSGDPSDLGNFISIDLYADGDLDNRRNDNKFNHIFGHMDGPSLKGWKQDDIVYLNQPLGRVLASGYSREPDDPKGGNFHLHWQMRFRGQMICPFRDGILQPEVREWLLRRAIPSNELQINQSYRYCIPAGVTQDYWFRSNRPIAKLMHTRNPKGPVAGYDMLTREIPRLSNLRISEDRMSVFFRFAHTDDPKWNGMYEYVAFDDDGHATQPVEIIVT